MSQEPITCANTADSQSDSSVVSALLELSSTMIYLYVHWLYHQFLEKNQALVQIYTFSSCAH